MSVEALCRRVTQFGFTLLEAEFAMDARQHWVERLSAKRKSLIWTRTGDQALITANPARVLDYLALLEHQEYSYLMHDGGLVQVAYVFDGKGIERHRLLYYPCPFRVDAREVQRQGGAFLDYLIDNFMGDLEANLLLKSPLRFDFAPEAAAEFHPASHLTLNDSCCRIPARAPLGFDTFMKFILENFYHAAWATLAVRRELHFAHEAECLSAHDSQRAYLNWAHP